MPTNEPSRFSQVILLCAMEWGVPGIATVRIISPSQNLRFVKSVSLENGWPCASLRRAIREHLLEDDALQRICRDEPLEFLGDVIGLEARSRLASC
jgi:hypothetical protein